MIHEWILHNGICITYHSEKEWLQIDYSNINDLRLKPVRFKEVGNGIDNAKKQGNFYWRDYSRYYTEGDTETKGEPFSFYMKRNSQFEKTYENEKNIQYLQNVGFDLEYLRDRRYKDRMPRITWQNYRNTESIKSYKRLPDSNDADERYRNSWTIFERYENLGCILGCLLPIIGFIVVFFLILIAS